MTPTGSLNWEEDKNWVHRSPGVEITGQSRAVMWLIDPRVVAWGAIDDQRRVSDPYHMIKEDSFNSEKIAGVRLDSIGRTEIRWQPNQHVLVSLTLNGSQGFVPDACVIRYRKAKIDDQSSVYFPTRVTLSKWEEFGGTLVPVSSTTTGINGVKNKTTVELKWRQVNEAVDEKQFTLLGLDLPAKTIVRDMVDGQSVLIGELDERKEIVPTSEMPKIGSSQAKNKDLRSTVAWLVLANGLLIASVIIFMIVKYRRRPQGGAS